MTAAAVYWLPGLLDPSEGSSIKKLEGVSKSSFDSSRSSQVVTRFPTRSFEKKASGPKTSKSSDNGGGESSDEVASTSSNGGLPSRAVPGVSEKSNLGERVTTRAYLMANSSVFAHPQTTAQVLGRVTSQTKVRWLEHATEGWETILLKDGRSAYVQSKTLSFSANSHTQSRDSFPSSGSQNSGGPDASALPNTIDNFLRHLSSNDLLRAETFLSPLAPSLDESTLGLLSGYVGTAPLGRLLRIERVSGDRSGHRRARLVYGEEMTLEVTTLWEWDHSQERWMLVRWN